jgi:hypothetical protein
MMRREVQGVGGDQTCVVVLFESAVDFARVRAAAPRDPNFRVTDKVVWISDRFSCAMLQKGDKNMAAQVK